MAEVYMAAGHGYTDAGNWDPGCCYGGDQEAILVKNIMIEANKLLRASGITVYSDAESGNSKNRATIDEANRIGTDLYVSLHCDYSGAPSGTLPLVYYNSIGGHKIASCLVNAVANIMGLSQRSLWEVDDYFEVRDTNMPSVIFETGSIKADNDVLKDAANYGRAVAQGICDYFGVSLSGGVVTPPGKIAEDGRIGEDTIVHWQKVLDAPTLDGEISGQLPGAEDYVWNVTSDWVFISTGQGSDTVKLWQTLLNKEIDAGLEVDGYCGEQTVIATQKFLNKVLNAGLEVDGILGYQTALYLQKWINKQL